MFTDWLTVRVTREQLEKVREMASNGSPSAGEWLRQKIEAEYDGFKSQRDAEDAAAVAELNEDELQMAANLNLRPSEYLKGKRKSR